MHKRIFAAIIFALLVMLPGSQASAKPLSQWHLAHMSIDLGSHGASTAHVQDVALAGDPNVVAPTPNLTTMSTFTRFSAYRRLCRGYNIDSSLPDGCRQYKLTLNWYFWYNGAETYANTQESGVSNPWPNTENSYYDGIDPNTVAYKATLTWFGNTMPSPNPDSVVKGGADWTLQVCQYGGCHGDNPDKVELRMTGYPNGSCAFNYYGYYKGVQVKTDSNGCIHNT